MLTLNRQYKQTNTLAEPKLNCIENAHLKKTDRNDNYKDGLTTTFEVRNQGRSYRLRKNACACTLEPNQKSSVHSGCT